MSEELKSAATDYAAFKSKLNAFQLADAYLADIRCVHCGGECGEHSEACSSYLVQDGRVSKPTALELADQLERDPIVVQGRAAAMLRQLSADCSRLDALVAAQDRVIVLMLANRSWCAGEKVKEALAEITKLKGKVE